MADAPTYQVGGRLNVGNGCGGGHVFGIETCAVDAQV
jgi:hypothetical protein